MAIAYKFILMISILPIIFVDSMKCLQKSPCSCQLEDKRMIDLHKLEKENFLEASDGNLTYYFHACTDGKPNLPSNVNSSQCDSVSLCLFNKVNNSVTNLGHAKDAKFTSGSVGNSNNQFLVFDNTTIITLVCSDYADSIMHLVSKDKKLILFSPFNCPFSIHEGLSVGSVVIILFLVFVSIYFFGGAIILHFLRGARGKEMIPNVDFWTDLPYLVRDGIVYIQNGCRPVISGSDSYDRI